jgi:beta-glucosidase
VRCLDFVGLNYHSHSFVRYRFKSFFTRNPIEIMLPHTSLTLMSDATNACIYPEGLYRSLMQLKAVLPNTDVYVTENGIADKQDDRRHLYLRRHMYALSLALAHGARVRGYFFWTLFDCFEWHEGHTLKFGLFALDKRTQKRTLRDGSKYYQQICQRWAKKQIKGGVGGTSGAAAGAGGITPSPSPPPQLQQQQQAHHQPHPSWDAASFGQGHVDKHQPRGSAGSGMLGSQLILRY